MSVNVGVNSDSLFNLYCFGTFKVFFASQEVASLILVRTPENWGQKEDIESLLN